MVWLCGMDRSEQDRVTIEVNVHIERAPASFVPSLAVTSVRHGGIERSSAGERYAAEIDVDMAEAGASQVRIRAEEFDRNVERESFLLELLFDPYVRIRALSARAPEICYRRRWRVHLVPGECSGS